MTERHLRLMGYFPQSGGAAGELWRARLWMLRDLLGFYGPRWVRRHLAADGDAPFPAPASRPRPVIPTRFLDHLRRPRRGNRLAFVFYATDEDHAVAVMVFVRMLRELGIRQDADVVALHLPLNAAFVEHMRRLGIRTRLVAPVPGARGSYYRHCLVKLRALKLTEYDRILYADADAIPLKSLDELLSLPLNAPIAAPRAYWLRQPFWTSALLIIRPSKALWKRARRHFSGADRNNRFDMDIINVEFAKEIQSLPSTVFCLDSEWANTARPGFFVDPENAYKLVSVVHYSNMGKPWTRPTAEVRRLRPDAHPIFYEIWDKWHVTRERLFS